MKKGFTLIELVIAIALLAMALGFSGIVFKVSTDMHRTSGANAEIMQNLRAITNQLNTDFKGLRKDAPLLIAFKEYPVNPELAQRFDQIMFFADGDFQSNQLYDGEPAIPSNIGQQIRGNVARIYYGLCRNSQNNRPFDITNAKERLLGRRQHILSADPGLDNWPDSNNVNGTFDDEFSHNYLKNELYEHDSLSLAKWKTLDNTYYHNELGGTILDTCFETPPWVDMNNPATFHNLMCEGIGSFSIQWGYWDSETANNPQLRWFPDNDPHEDGSFTDSHFTLLQPVAGEHKFGVSINVPLKESREVFVFYIMQEGKVKYSSIPSTKIFSPDFYPQALKFTFTLYDSKGIIKDGKTFTHIVYMGE